MGAKVFQTDGPNQSGAPKKLQCLKLVPSICSTGWFSSPWISSACVESVDLRWLGYCQVLTTDTVVQIIFSCDGKKSLQMTKLVKVKV
eukprot:5055426-Amphidinium_carterae.1